MRIAIFETNKKEFILSTFRKYAANEVVAFVSPFRKKADEIESFYEGLPLLSIESLIQKYPHEIEGVFFGPHSPSNVDYWAYKLHDNGVDNIYIPYLNAIQKETDFLGGGGTSTLNTFMLLTLKNRLFISLWLMLLTTAI
jgi:hypothetical protein